MFLYTVNVDDSNVVDKDSKRVDSNSASVSEDTANVDDSDIVDVGSTEDVSDTLGAIVNVDDSNVVDKGSKRVDSNNSASVSEDTANVDDSDIVDVGSTEDVSDTLGAIVNVDDSNVVDKGSKRVDSNSSASVSTLEEIANDSNDVTFNDIDNEESMLNTSNWKNTRVDTKIDRILSL